MNMEILGNAVAAYVTKEVGKAAADFIVTVGASTLGGVADAIMCGDPSCIFDGFCDGLGTQMEKFLNGCVDNISNLDDFISIFA